MGLAPLLSVATFYMYINFVKEIPLTASKCRKAVSHFYGDKPISKFRFTGRTSLRSGTGNK